MHMLDLWSASGSIYVSWWKVRSSFHQYSFCFAPCRAGCVHQHCSLWKGLVVFCWPLHSLFQIQGHRINTTSLLRSRPVIMPVITVYFNVDKVSFQGIFPGATWRSLSTNLPFHFSFGSQGDFCSQYFLAFKGCVSLESSATQAPSWHLEAYLCIWYTWTIFKGSVTINTFSCLSKKMWEMLPAYYNTTTIVHVQRRIIWRPARQKACKDDVGGLDQVESDFIVRPFSSDM